MLIRMTNTECGWLINLARNAKYEAILANETTPHPLLQLQRENMEYLENKLNTALQKEIKRERWDAR
jgi:hypothetical protein